MEAPTPMRRLGWDVAGTIVVLNRAASADVGGIGRQRICDPDPVQRHDAVVTDNDRVLDRLASVDKGVSVTPDDHPLFPDVEHGKRQDGVAEVQKRIAGRSRSGILTPGAVILVPSTV